MIYMDGMEGTSTTLYYNHEIGVLPYWFLFTTIIKQWLSDFLYTKFIQNYWCLNLLLNLNITNRHKYPLKSVINGITKILN